MAIALVILSIALAGARAEVSTIFRDANTSLALSDLNAYAGEVVANPMALIDDSGKGFLISIRDPAGRIELDTLPHSIHRLLEDRAGADETFAVDSDGTAFLVVGRVVTTTTGDWSLWAARSEAASDLSLRRLDLVFSVGAAVLLGAFGVASWLLATASLRPVVLLRRKAERLGVDSIDTLPVGDTRDEVSELAVTLNGFVERLRAATAREKQVVSDAAHELRTPLAALRTQLELAHDDFDDAQALAAQVVAAEKSVSRLSALATNLLELSRLETRSGRRVSSSDQLITELMGSIDRARMIGLAKGADVGFTVDLGNFDEKFSIGGEDFARLLDNLLSNAISAIEDGGTVLAVVTRDDRGCVIRISDSGPGMSENFLPRAFDRFSRPDDSRTARSGGSGLGLALVKAIAVSAGGSVTLENASTTIVLDGGTGPGLAHPGGLIATVQLPRAPRQPPPAQM